MRLETLGFETVYRYAAGKADWLAAGLPSEGDRAAEPRFGPLARADVPRCRLDDRLSAVRERVHSAGWDMCVVTDDSGVVLGLLGPDVVHSNGEGRIEDVMDPAPSTYRANVGTDEVEGDVLVTTPDGVLLGAVIQRR